MNDFLFFTLRHWLTYKSKVEECSWSGKTLWDMQMKMGNCAYSYSYRCERCIQQTETVAELKLNFPGSTYIYATLRRSLWSSNWKCEKGKRKKGRWLCPANEQLIDKRQRVCVCSTKDKGPWARKIRLREWKAQRFSNARCCRRNCLLISVYCFSLRQRCGLIVIIVEFLWVSSEAVKESCVNVRLKPREMTSEPKELTCNEQDNNYSQSCISQILFIIETSQILRKRTIVENCSDTFIFSTVSSFTNYQSNQSNLSTQ